MTVALILAGGSGKRMQSSYPKQFLMVDGSPVIIYTMQVFQRYSGIDCIAVVCIDGWQEKLREYADQYGISKLRWIVPGGETVQESIRNGIYYLETACDREDIVVIHDAVRPLVEVFVLEDVLSKCQQYGNGVAALPYNEQMFIEDDGISTVEYIPREKLRKVVTPQAYRLGILADKYREAYRRGIGIQTSAYANTMMAELGERLFFSAGSEKNIKLTTEEDIDIFRALLMARKFSDSNSREREE